jgi:hypothetical protein
MIEPADFQVLRRCAPRHTQQRNTDPKSATHRATVPATAQHLPGVACASAAPPVTVEATDWCVTFLLACVVLAQVIGIVRRRGESRRSA